MGYVTKTWLYKQLETNESQCNARWQGHMFTLHQDPAPFRKVKAFQFRPNDDISFQFIPNYPIASFVTVRRSWSEAASRSLMAWRKASPATCVASALRCKAIHLLTQLLIQEIAWRAPKTLKLVALLSKSETARVLRLPRTHMPIDGNRFFVHPGA